MSRDDLLAAVGAFQQAAENCQYHRVVWWDGYDWSSDLWLDALLPPGYCLVGPVNPTLPDPWWIGNLARPGQAVGEAAADLLPLVQAAGGWYEGASDLIGGLMAEQDPGWERPGDWWSEPESPWPDALQGLRYQIDFCRGLTGTGYQHFPGGVIVPYLFYAYARVVDALAYLAGRWKDEGAVPRRIVDTLERDLALPGWPERWTYEIDLRARLLDSVVAFHHAVAIVLSTYDLWYWKLDFGAYWAAWDRLYDAAAIIGGDLEAAWYADDPAARYAMQYLATRD
jgi:hypothetical protein